MAWDVNEDTMAVTMHQGDTGAYWVDLELEDGDEFIEGDVAIYEVWSGQTKLVHKEFELQPETPTDICPGDGSFLIAFLNSDTDTWPVGTYNTEIRVSLNPIRSDGSVVDGDTVRTVVQSTIQINHVYINIEGRRMNMSEVNPSELVRRVSFRLRSASVIPTPIDPTLSHQGESADAYATGQAIAGVLDGVKVNGKTASNKEFTVYAGDIMMSSESGALTIAEAVEEAGDKDANDIMYDSTNLVTIKDALDDIYDTLDSELDTEDIDTIFASVFGGE